MIPLDFWGYIFLAIYSICLLFITAYCLGQLALYIVYLWKRSMIIPKAKLEESEWPRVAVQLPIYNEKFVVNRLLDAIAALDYPKDKLIIQVLDDSTDETTDLVAAKVLTLLNDGFSIQHLHRKDRIGFKAGALKEGLRQLETEFIAIFDADFVPKKSFLKDTMPYFSNSSYGVIQTRWGHLNQGDGFLTQLQAIQLNVHFTVEQYGRYLGSWFLQFNGTAGIWRKQAIEEAGGWEADTLTEDLDLSFRAQLKGWKILYLEQVEAPAELPTDILGLKSQQFRWMKGGAETARKILKTFLSSDVAISTKIVGAFHLLASTLFVTILLLGISSVGMLIFWEQIQFSLQYYSFFLISFFAILLIYLTVNVFIIKDSGPWAVRLVKFLFYFPWFLAMSMGLAFHNAWAVIEGWLGMKSPFIRTPKLGLGTGSQFHSKQTYTAQIRQKWQFGVELLLALLYLWSIIYAVKEENYVFIVFHLMLFIGYGAVFCLSMRSLWKKP